MSLVGFKARNHRQQIEAGGVDKNTDNRATPPEVFAGFHERFSFTVDACALPHNAKLKRYFTPELNGLVQDWTGERVWCNPPYSTLEPWVEKAWTGGAELVVMLVPSNRTEQGWWQRHIEPFRDGRDLTGGGIECRVPPRPYALHCAVREGHKAERAPALRGLPSDLRAPVPGYRKAADGA